MKIVRFLSEKNQILYGVHMPEKPGWAQIIQGDIFSRFHITDSCVKIETYLPPVEPVNIFALGLNYRKHADETRMAYPEIPIIFMKATTSAIGYMSPILLPSAGPDEVDYEAELAIIIGKKVKNIPPEYAMDCILGYTCANDVSARDWQIHKQKKQWTRGKSFDTFCPLGPWLVTRDEIQDPHVLQIRAIVNGRILQNSTTADMIFDVPTIVSDLSRSITLMPGTVILTGTPEGVGFTRTPPLYLREGDVVSVEIEKIGTLTNPVTREEKINDRS